MNDKKLGKLSKKELLEILLAQSKRIEELEESLTITKSKLASKEIIINESGSLAEACLKLNDIFEIAQKTADQYILNIKEKCKKMEKETEVLCQKREKETEEYLLKIQSQVKKLTKNKNERTITRNELTPPEYTKIVTAKKEINNKKTNTIKGRPVRKIKKGKNIYEQTKQ